MSSTRKNLTEHPIDRGIFLNNFVNRYEELKLPNEYEGAVTSNKSDVYTSLYAFFVCECIGR